MVPHQPGLRLYRHGGSDLVIERFGAEGAVRGDVQRFAHFHAAQLVRRSGRQAVRRAELGVGLQPGIVGGQVGTQRAQGGRLFRTGPPGGSAGGGERFFHAVGQQDRGERRKAVGHAVQLLGGGRHKGVRVASSRTATPYCGSMRTGPGVFASGRVLLRT